MPLTPAETTTGEHAESLANNANHALLRLERGGWALAHRSRLLSPKRGEYVTHYIVERFDGEADEALRRFELFKCGLS